MASQIPGGTIHDNILIIIGDFNIWYSTWNPIYPHSSPHTNDFLSITDNFDLNLSQPTNPSPIKLVDNLVINLLFLNSNNPGFNKHIILSKIQRPSDHTLLFVEIGINEANIDIFKTSIKQDSQEEKDYIFFIIQQFLLVLTDNIHIPLYLVLPSAMVVSKSSIVNTYSLCYPSSLPSSLDKHNLPKRQSNLLSKHWTTL